ncbi:MAG TPA: TraB/GumN family protein [Candidatus Kapabacteria bacterium]|nr:TraB/GumN family protein [Candidatus Kapabacteria bacterium]
MSILTRILIPAVLLLLTVCGSMPAQEPVEPTLLWEISGNGLEKPSYLYGTIHVRKREAFRLNDSVLPALRSCAVFASELEFDTLARQFIEEYLIPEDGLERLVRLRTEHVSPDTDEVAAFRPSEGGQGAADTDTVQHASADADVGIEGKPKGPPERHAVRSHAQRRVLAALDPRRRGTSIFVGADTVGRTDKPAVIDSYLFGIARNAGLKLTGLETVNEQLGLIGSFGFEDMYTRLKRRRKQKLSRQTDDDPESMLVNAYAKGDLARLYELVSDMPPTVRKRLLDDRNHVMAERGEKLIRTAPTFIAVGSGHLLGAEGLIALFRERGYTVRPVKSVYSKGPDDYGTPARIPAWQTFASAEGAFSVEMPQPPIAMPGDSMPGYLAGRWDRLRSWVWPDLGSGLTFVVGYLDYDDAGRLQDTSTLQSALGTVFSDMEAQMPAYRSAGPAMEGHPLLESESRTGFNLTRRFRSLLRGHRGYVVQVVAVESQVHSEDADRFLSSFRLLPFGEMPWTAYDGSDYGFMVALPGAAHEANDVNNDNLAYRVMTLVAIDSLSGRHTLVQCREFSNYYTATDSSAVWARAIRLELAYDECLESIHPAHTGGCGGVDLVIASRANETARRRVRFILQGPMLYMLRQGGAPDSSAGADRLLNSFRLTGPALPGSVFAPKVDRLLRDLDAADAVQRQRARAAIGAYPFAVADLPKIYRLLSSPLIDDSTVSERYAAYENGSSRNRLLFALVTVHDSTTVPFLRRNFMMDVNSASSRSEILNVLVSIGSEEASAAVGDLLDEIREEENDLRLPFNRFYGDIAGLRPMIPHMLALAGRGAYTDDIYPLIMTAIDSGIVGREVLESNRVRILKDCRDMLREQAVLKAHASPGDDGEDAASAGSAFQMRAPTMAALLGYLDVSEESIAVLKKFASCSEPEAEFAALRALARLNQVLPQGAVRSVASDLQYRTRLYTELDRLGYAKAIPAALRSQQSIAEGVLADWIVDSDDGEGPAVTSIKLVGEREIHAGDTAIAPEGRYFLFEFSVGDEKRMVGLSGPQPLDRTRVDAVSSSAYTDFDPLGGGSADRRFEKLLSAVKHAREAGGE